MSLASQHDLLILDLDGVVYIGTQPVPGAAEALAELDGPDIAYATNNASRRAGEVAELLAAVGVRATEDQVLTSAQAAAELLAKQFPAGARVLVVGAQALRDEVATAGLTPVTSAEGAAAVVQGYAPTVGWNELAEACVAVRGGARWVATNTDSTLPSPRGPLPGNGSLVAALATALQRQPDTVVGKPAPELFRVAVSRHSATNPLVVGDRLDTDIEGAVNAGMPSLLVLTGVTTPAELLRAAPNHRPTYLATDLSGLSMKDDLVRVPPWNSDAADSRAGGWRVTHDGGRLHLAGDGDDLDALRALARGAWVHTGWTAIEADPSVLARLRLSEQLA